MEEKKEEKPEKMVRVQIHAKSTIYFSNNVEITEKEFARLDGMDEYDLVEELFKLSFFKHASREIEITKFMKGSANERGQPMSNGRHKLDCSPTTKEFIGQSNVEINYYNAIQEGKFALLKNLAIYLGKKMEPSIAGNRYLWKNPGGLCVYYNETNNFVLVCYEKKVLASSTLNNPLFCPGDWWEVIAQIKSRVEESMKQAEASKLKMTQSSYATAACPAA